MIVDGHLYIKLGNVNTDIVPSNMQNLNPSLVSEISDYPLRTNRNISVPFNKPVFHRNIAFHYTLMLIKRRPPQFTGFVENKYRHKHVTITNLYI